MQRKNNKQQNPDPVISKKKKTLLKRELHKEGQEILLQIEKIKGQIELTRKNFDFATDSTLIDSYIYELISLNKKYDYFLQQAKKNGLIAHGTQKIS